MEELDTGDNVLTVNTGTGKTEFSTVYMWGHRNADSTSTFYEINAENGAKLSLSPEHYMYVSESGSTNATLSSATTLSPSLMKVGQGIWTMTTDGPACSAITSIRQSEQKGLFNPMTLSGTIVVNDVLASCYSEHKDIMIESNLRSLMNAENVARNAPSLHHTLFAPARQLFRTFGLDWAKRVTSPHEKEGWENLTMSGVMSDIVREIMV